MLNEFRPSLFFLVRFLGIYFAGNLLYGLYVASFGDEADSITWLVTTHTTVVLNLLGYSVNPAANQQGPTVFIETPDKIVLSVYEGCNGLNVMVLFMAFVIAFGGPHRKMYWFIPLGILIIHLANLIRLSLLVFVSEYHREYFYYVHKYIFTAVIYIVVFVLWIVWVAKFNLKERGDSKRT